MDVKTTPVNAPLTGRHEDSVPGRQSDASPEAELLIRLHAQLGSWEKVAVRLGVNRGLVWMVAHGKIVSPTVSRRLNRDYCRPGESADHEFLRIIRQEAVPWLQGRQTVHPRKRPDK